MTPIGHYSTSMLVGTVAWRITGSPLIGSIFALLTHIPADLTLNEFYQWGNNPKERMLNRIKMFACLLPAIILLLIVSKESNMYAPSFFGLLGAVPDVLDEMFARLFGFSIFPCHAGSLFYIPAYFGKTEFVKMASMRETAVLETALAVISSLFTLAVMALY